ncbi:hypothetical protein [Paraburkholderia lacunae]|uniref:Uncharacterized protein n=1 Tax=Paraburkholderia lacunae TaxID=2211104 RepID=A0A370N7T6_9BURK|nr:hypothetical protein [Paraburkholderia lacunae]RDK01615.1 hypothetical protein DLM46_17595 [Paraburkholderia lacunae]
MTVEIKADFYEMPDKTHRVEITYEGHTQSFTPETLSAFMNGLAQVREQLNPPIQSDPPLGEMTHVSLDPKFYTEPNPMIDGSSLYVRHPAFGWLGFGIPLESLETLQGLLSAQIELGRQARGKNPN